MEMYSIHVIVLFLKLCSLVVSLGETEDVTTLWVVYNSTQDNFEVHKTRPAEYIAVASLKNSVNQTGWAILDVKTNAGLDQKFTDRQQAYAAGFIEGHITRSLMSMHWINTQAGVCPEPLSQQCSKIKKFLETNLEWMKKAIQLSAQKIAFWHHVELFLLQSAGLQDGYANGPGVLNMNINVLGVYSWQVGGDMEDITQLFPSSSSKHQYDKEDLMGMGTGHCSALLRLLPGNTDLYVAQDTWSELSSMLRILKKYSMELHLLPGNYDLIQGTTMTFSSYPGSLYSGDDFYAISSGLVSQETTIGNSNMNLLVYITPESVLEGIRTMVANRLASSGEEWSRVFSLYNSGTYNNQWMIVDYKKFKPGRDTPVPGIFYLLEQIPGTIEYHDMSDLLYTQGYFGSYNIAFYPDIFNKSGMPPLVKKFGDWFTYDKSPRALIFKRDVPGVKDVKSMIKLMRYNNYKEDPLSRCNCTPPYSAENAIACRDDLNPVDGKYPFDALGHRPHIATDMKLTTASLFQSLSFLAISSPTYDDLPPFQWSTSDYRSSLSHVGHPDLWKFPVITLNGTHPFA